MAVGSGPLPRLGVVLMGLGFGSEIDLIAFLTSRYFGQRVFGEIYGYFFMIFGFGTAIGPAAAWGDVPDGRLLPARADRRRSGAGALNDRCQFAWRLCLSGRTWQGHHRVRPADGTGLVMCFGSFDGGLVRSSRL